MSPIKLSRGVVAPFLRRAMSSSTTVMNGKLTLPKLPIFEALSKQPPSKPAIIHSASGKKFTYGSLLSDTAKLKNRLLAPDGPNGENAENGDLKEKRIAVLVENGYDYVVSMLSIFAAGGIAVPLCTAHPIPEMRYVLTNSLPSLLLTTEKFHKVAAEAVDPFKPELLPLEVVPKHAPSSNSSPEPVELTKTIWHQPSSDPENDREGRGALMIYTSGTTSAPKGVITTHHGLTSQSTCLVDAWEINDKDHLLHILPLHHVHGVVNGTLAPLFAGGTVEYLFPFTASGVLSRFAASGKEKEKISLFFAVPTVYSRLLSTLPTLPESEQAAVKESIASLRLAISGSAALPGAIKDQWLALAGTPAGGGTILERYGMTEIGMALSNRLPLHERINDSVGWPLPGVEARLLDVDTGKVIPETAEGVRKPGEIQIRGPNVFREYWQKEEATRKEFMDGWFKTGDVAVRDEKGAYYIKGRASVDIIKTGGEKVSALEIEQAMLSLPQIAEATVVGLPDPDWGQKVAAIVVLTKRGEDEKFGYEEMRAVLKERLAAYKVPRELKVVEGHIPRNQMGKVNKKTLVKEIFG
ncbi:hypothetical protein RUND412_004992 [Rhizina undulata]